MTEADVLKLLLPTLGPTAGCVVVVWLFIKFLTNHMSGQMKALSDVCSALAGLKAVIDECHQRRTR